MEAESPNKFIYAFFCAGAITCFVSLTGHVAAELSNSFCLGCYSVLQVVLILAQFAVAGLLFFDRHWREDVPDDPTGQLDKVQKFVVENLDICKWIALGVVLLEVLGLFFAFILRAISSNSRRNYDSDDDYMVPRSAPRQRANNAQANQAIPAAGSGGAAAENRPRSDPWATRMREKYNLDTTEFTANQSESRRFAQQNQTPGAEEQQSPLQREDIGAIFLFHRAEQEFGSGMVLGHERFKCLERWWWCTRALYKAVLSSLYC